MARGFNYAAGASPELDEARQPFMHRATMAMHGVSKNPLVRQIIAERVDCPFGLMVTLAHDGETDVRAAVAANPSAVAAILEHLAQDKEVDVLLALLSNPGLPAPVLEKLVFHRRPTVRLAAAERLDGRGPQAVPAVEDYHTPELRDIGLGATYADTGLVTPRPLGAVAEGVALVTPLAPPVAPPAPAEAVPFRPIGARMRGIVYDEPAAASDVETASLAQRA